MVTIDVDFDVFKAITNRRADESVTNNDVLRALLKLGPAAKEAPSARKGWTWKGVTLPHGTQLRAEHKGQAHLAEIVDGQWMQDGESYSSPSAAAFAITEYGINGWRFWEAKRPTDTAWQQLGRLRE